MRVRNGNGTGVRYDRDGGGNHILRERDKSHLGVFLNYGKRFCASCQEYKPKGKGKAVKGRLCEDCRMVRQNAARNRHANGPGHFHQQSSED